MLALLVVFVRVFGDWGDYWRRGGQPRRHAGDLGVGGACCARLRALVHVRGTRRVVGRPRGQAVERDKEIVDAAISLHLILMFIIPMQMHYDDDEDDDD